MSVGGEFLTFQWDILLIETAFLGIFLAPAVWLGPSSGPASSVTPREVANLAPPLQAHV